MLPTTIHQVLEELINIRNQCVSKNSRLALFTQVYYLTTKNVLNAIEAREFEDSRRMEKFDVAFANMFIKAYRQFNSNEDCSQVWQVVFDHQFTKLTVVQQVLLGMNAHINYDLGVVCNEFFKQDELKDFERDFLHINNVLQKSIDQMQEGIGKVSPLFFLLDWIGNTGDEKLIDFSMRHARGQAWRLACRLSESKSEFEREMLQQQSDAAFSLFALGIAKPRRKLLRVALSLISVFEEKRISKIVAKLS